MLGKKKFGKEFAFHSMVTLKSKAMKTRIYTIGLLMLTLTLASFAQPSRRGEQGRHSTNQNSSNNQTVRLNNNRQSTRAYNNQTVGRENKESFNRPSVSPNTSSRHATNNTALRGNDRGSSNGTSVSTNNSSTRNNADRREFRGEPSTRAPQVNNANNHVERTPAVTSNGTRRSPVHAGNYVENHRGRESGRVSRPVSSYRPPMIAHHHNEPVRIHTEWYHYRKPLHTYIYWNAGLHYDFRIYYPEIRVWRYPVGYRILAIPAYDAFGYVGEVANVYGRVSEVYYTYQTDEYYLYFGDYYPYHDFSIVIPGYEARFFSSRPDRYFENSHITVTGYVTSDEGKPEIVVHSAKQIEVY
jgi:hypothetical protein